MDWEFGLTGGIARGDALGPGFQEPRSTGQRQKRIGRDKEEAAMSKVKALISADRPVIRIYGEDTDDYIEIRFETQNDANVAVERFNELLKKATGLLFSSGMRGT